MAKLDGKRSGTIIFDDLAFKLTPSERIIFGVVHRFSGYKLGECRLKPNSIAEIAGVSRSTVYSVLNRLSDLGMIEILKHEKSSGASFKAYRTIKDNLDDLAPVSAEEIETRELEILEQKGDESAKLGNATVNDLFDWWFQFTGNPIGSRVKANRRAAWNLARKHSQEKLEQMIKLSNVAFFNDYAPQIADFVDLQSKWSQLELWAEKRAHSKLMSEFEKMSIEDRVQFKEDNPELAKIIDKKRKAM